MEPGLAGLLVGAVTFETVIGKDGEDLTAEVDAVGGCDDARESDATENGQQRNGARENAISYERHESAFMG